MDEDSDKYVFQDITAFDYKFYWAFRDLNGNDAIDPGEPFGLAPGNPQDLDTDDNDSCCFDVEIRIDRIYQPE